MDLDDGDSNFLHSGERPGGITDNSSVIESNIESRNKLSIADETEEDCSERIKTILTIESTLLHTCSERIKTKGKSPSHCSKYQPD